MAPPLIVDVRRGSHEDGPGIRSVVFFKGCPLRCVFCQNPEAQDPAPEIAHYPEACVGCGDCARACPEGSIRLERPGAIHRDRCKRCGTCVEACKAGGLQLIGKPYSLEELVELLVRDRPFFRHSGGGVTLSGGECTLYPNHVGQLARELKRQGVHLVLETSGHFDYEAFKEALLPNLDLIFFDLKIADPEDHKRHTGRSNDRILENLRRLLDEGGVEVHPRIPLIPGITANEQNLAALAEILRQVGAPRVSLLPYNPLGPQMNERLGRQPSWLPESFMKPEEERKLFALFGRLIQDQSTATAAE